MRKFRIICLIFLFLLKIQNFIASASDNEEDKEQKIHRSRSRSNEKPQDIKSNADKQEKNFIKLQKQDSFIKKRERPKSNTNKKNSEVDPKQREFMDSFFKKKV
jgi:hypothetical protein